MPEGWKPRMVVDLMENGPLQKRDKGCEWIVETHIMTDVGEHDVQVMWSLVDAIKSFIEQPVFIFGISWITNGRTNIGEFIIWQMSTTKCIFIIALQKDLFLCDCIQTRQSKRSVFEHWIISWRLPVTLISIFAQDNNSGHSSVWPTNFIRFNN